MTSKIKNQVYANDMKSADIAKLEILSNRLGISFNEAKKLQEGLRVNLAKSLGIISSAIVSDIEPAGRDLDLIFVMNKQNLPRK